METKETSYRRRRKAKSQIEKNTVFTCDTPEMVECCGHVSFESFHERAHLGKHQLPSSPYLGRLLLDQNKKCSSMECCYWFVENLNVA